MQDRGRSVEGKSSVWPRLSYWPKGGCCGCGGVARGAAGVWCCYVSCKEYESCLGEVPKQKDWHSC